ncbi:uncharacterized protein [Ptychodera flava]|uniref:uncharacterized protein isoform X2 n=1 Tax=Ptychodera flava TaxID=63121 RepID=UPI00396A6C3C
MPYVGDVSYGSRVEDGRLKLPPIAGARPRSRLRISHGHLVEFGTSYANDFPPKSLAGREPRPSSKSRKHNPHPSQVYHLRRLYNEPVCHVRTLFRGPESMVEDTTDGYLVTSMKEHYPPRKISSHKNTRFGCNNQKKHFADGIVPHDSEKVPAATTPTRFPERMLPACTRTTTMTTDNPFLPKRKRLEPPSMGEGWDVSEPLSFLVEDDVGHSIGVRKPMRKRQIPGSRRTTLQVASFNGSLPADQSTSITGRKLCHRPAEFYDYYQRTWGSAKAKPKWVEPF